jgi:hypothetical protein
MGLTMQGTMLIYTADDGVDDPPEIRQLTAPPTGQELHEFVGGYLEVVPYFWSIRNADGLHRCAAFCNEDGQRLGMPINRRGTLLWEAAAERQGLLLRDEHGNYRTTLLGPVVIVFGDRKLMAAL